MSRAHSMLPFDIPKMPFDVLSLPLITIGCPLTSIGCRPAVVTIVDNFALCGQVRKLVKEGKLDEARQMCEEQTHAALGHLQGDPAWRKEYLDLWLHQRPPPYRITFDDYDFDGEQHII